MAAVTISHAVSQEVAYRLSNFDW